MPTYKPIYQETQFNFDPDGNEALKTIACKWAEEELKLKMVLLGNFLETYFMPVHSELMHSTVEDMVDCVLDMNFTAGGGFQDEIINTNTSFELTWGDPVDPDNPDNPIPDDPYSTHTIYTDEVHVYAGVDFETPYGNAFENRSTEPLRDDPDIIPIIACHTYDETGLAKTGISDAPLRGAIFGQVFNGIGAVENAHFSFPEPIISGKCISDQWGYNIGTSFNGVSNPQSEFDIKFLFPKPGKFTFYFTFVGKSGAQYTKSVNVEVADGLSVDVGFYKLVAKPDAGISTVNPFTDSADLRISSTISREHDYVVVGDEITVGTDIKYTQYIPAGKSGSAPDAPYFAKVRILQWQKSDASNRDAYYNELIRTLDQTRFAIDKGVDNFENETGTFINTAWIRVCSKYKGASLPTMETKPAGLVRYYDLDVFFPEFHELKRIKDCERIDSCYPVVCVPEVVTSDGKVARRLNYSELAGEPSWEFYSYGRDEVIGEITKPIQTPLIATTLRDPIPRGYYRITFNYRSGLQNKTIIKSPSWLIETK